MPKSISLDEAIVAVLTGLCTSEQAAAVLADAEAVLRDLTSQADAADVASLDPLATSAQARKLRTEAGDHRFEADRMEASVSALSARLADLKDAERAARRQAEMDAVRARRDALAADIAEQYPDIVAKLTSLVQRIVANDTECARFSLESAEAIGRGIPASFYSNLGPVIRIQDRAPATVDGMRLAYDHSISGWQYAGLLANSDGERS